MKASTLSKSSETSENDSLEIKQAKQYLASPPLEADGIFPLPGSFKNPETTYFSPYFQDSYQFPWNPDTLTNGNNYSIYDEMKNDDQVKAALSFKKDIVVNSGWRIVCDNEEIREFLTRILSEELDEEETGKSFDDILRDILSAYDYGFSLSETVYKLEDSDNKYRYKSIKVRPPHSFRFNLDRFGSISSIVQATDQGDKEHAPYKFIHHVYQQDFGNPYGKSDLKAAHSAWAAKKFFMRFFAIYIERFASPTVVGKYNSNMTPSDITRFHAMLKTIQTNTALAIPDETILDFLQPQRDSSDSYIKALNLFNLWISRALLVPDLIGISGDKTSGGSYALGESQFKMFLSTIEKDRKSLARKITLKLIRPIVQINFGDYPCAFEFNPVTQEDEIEYSKVWSDLIKSRIYKPTEEEINHFRRSVKYPEGPIEIQDPVNPFDKESDDENEKEDEEKKKEFSLKTFRELSSYEKVVNFSEIKRILNTSEDRILPRLRLAGKAIYNDLIDQVKAKGLVRNSQPEKISTLQPRFLRDMNILFRNYFTDLFKNTYEETRSELFPNGSRKFTDAELLPEEFLKLIDMESFESVGNYVNDFTKKGKAALIDGIKSGYSESRITAAMKDAMEQASEKWLETVIRTKTTEIYNAGRKIYWETDPIASQLVEAYEFSAIMDDRTCFKSDTLVQLANGQHKRIEKIEPGEWVISGSGKRKKVIGLKKYFTGQWRRITFQNGEILQATDNHPFWSIRSNSFSWMESKNLSKNDRIGSIQLSLLQKAFYSLQEISGKIVQILFSAMLFLKDKRNISESHMQAMRKEIQGQEIVCGQKSTFGFLLFNELLKNWKKAWVIGRKYNFYMRGLPFCLHEETKSGIKTWKCGPMVLTKMSNTKKDNFLSVLQETIRGKVSFAAILFSFLLQKIWFRDTTGNNGSEGIGNGGYPVQAGIFSRSILSRFFNNGKHSFGNRREILAREKERFKENISYKKSEHETCAVQDRVGIDSCDADRISKITHQGNTPTPNSTQKIASIEIINDFDWCYDLEVEDDHSYLVTKSNLIAHNSAICESLDGKIFEKGDFIDNITPPTHFNCRSILVPITKFSDYKNDDNYVKPGKEPSLENLKSLGGGLISDFSQKTRAHDFQIPPIRVSGQISMYGDTEVIASPGQTRNIQILSLHASNMNSYSPVVIGFRGTNEREIRYRTNLEIAGQPFQMQFPPDQPWTIESGKAFWINLSAQVEVDYTCEYIITDKRGKRVG